MGNYSGKLSHSGELSDAMPGRRTQFDTNSSTITISNGCEPRDLWHGRALGPMVRRRRQQSGTDGPECQSTAWPRTGRTATKPRNPSWIKIQNTGVLDNGANYDSSIDYAQIGLLDAGECLVDNLAVTYGGTNYVSNGTFETGGPGQLDPPGRPWCAPVWKPPVTEQPFAAHPLQRPHMDR